MYNHIEFLAEDFSPLEVLTIGDCFTEPEAEFGPTRDFVYMLIQCMNGKTGLVNLHTGFQVGFSFYPFPEFKDSTHIKVREHIEDTPRKFVFCTSTHWPRKFVRTESPFPKFSYKKIASEILQS